MEFISVVYFDSVFRMVYKKKSKKSKKSKKIRKTRESKNGLSRKGGLPKKMKERIKSGRVKNDHFEKEGSQIYKKKK